MYNFDNNIPIYLQIALEIKKDIIRKKYAPGEKLPSVREFALVTKTNPNTVLKALLELEAEGLINTFRTNGKYVVDDARIIEMKKEELVKERINDFIKEMNELNVDIEEIKEIIKRKEEKWWSKLKT